MPSLTRCDSQPLLGVQPPRVSNVPLSSNGSGKNPSASQPSSASTNHGAKKTSVMEESGLDSLPELSVLSISSSSTVSSALSDFSLQMRDGAHHTDTAVELKRVVLVGTIDEEHESANDLKSELEADILDGPDTIDTSQYKTMFAAFNAQVDALENSSEVMGCGYEYPREWLNQFQSSLSIAIDAWNAYQQEPTVIGCAPEKPSIGIFGYGSLMTPNGRAENLSGPMTQSLAHTDSSTVYGDGDDAHRTYLTRHVWMAGFTRGVALLGSDGVDAPFRVGVAGVQAQRVPADQPYDPSREINGVYLSNLSDDQLKQIHNREFAYFVLPGPPIAVGDPNGYRARFNLLCWPKGRDLIDRGYVDADGQQNDFSKQIFHEKLASVHLAPQDNLMDVPDDATVSFVKRYHEAPEQGQDYFDDYVRAHSDDDSERSLDTARSQYQKIEQLAQRVDCFYRLNQDCSVEPHRNYLLGSCLRYGAVGVDAVEQFLTTTRVKNQRGESQLALYAVRDMLGLESNASDRRLVIDIVNALKTMDNSS